MATNAKISEFKFMVSGYGHYRVTYTSPVTGKKWTTITNDMPLIDFTKNCEYPKYEHLNMLRRLCKNK